MNRTLRNAFASRPDERLLYALDIGSRNIVLSAAGRQGVAGPGPLWIEMGASKGIFKGVVSDLAALSDAVAGVIQKMEARSRRKIAEVALSINGNYIVARNSVAAVALAEHGTRSITRRDVERLRRQARHLGLDLNEHLFHEYPQGYSVDRHHATFNPLGLHGRRFEMDLLLVCAESGYVANIVKAVAQTGVDIVQVAYSGVAAAEAVISQEEKERGAILVDIGEALTGVLLFKDGFPRRIHTLSFGGKNLSEVIANYFRVSADLADEIKEGALELDSDPADGQEVMIKTQDAYRAISKKELVSVVEPEIDRFIATLRSVIFESGVSGLAAAPVVVTGGLSLVEGLLEKMEKGLGATVKMGLIKGRTDIPVSRIPVCASAIGLLALRSNLLREGTLEFHAKGKSKLAGLADYVVNLYRDYF